MPETLTRNDRAHAIREVWMRGLGDITQRLLGLDEQDVAERLQSALAVIGRLAEADGVSFLALDRQRGDLRGLYRWRADDGAGFATGLDFQRYRYISGLIESGRILSLDSPADLPPEAVDDRAGLERAGIGGYLLLPVRYGNDLLGVLDLRRSRSGGWNRSEVASLAFVAQLLGTALRRVIAERARRASDSRLQFLTTQIRDVVIELDLRGGISFLSDNFSDLCGYTRDELQQRTIWSLIAAEDLELLRQELRHIRDTGELPPVLTFRIRHKDGSWRWLEATVRLFDAPGGSRRLATVLRDCTDRQQAQLALQRQLAVEAAVSEISRELLEHSVERIDEGIARALESAGRLAGADRAFLISRFNASSSLAIYDWLRPGIRPRSIDFDLEGLRRSSAARVLLEQGIVCIPSLDALDSAHGDLLEALRRDGVRSLLGVPITSEGRVFGMLGFHCVEEERVWGEHDQAALRLIADVFHIGLRRKSAEQEAREHRERLLEIQKLEAVGTLAGGLSHDFNNQLTVMLANARFLSAELSANAEASAVLREIVDAAEHCAQLTRSLLAFSRRSASAPSALRVGDVVEGAAALIRSLLDPRIRFELRMQCAQAIVMADLQQLQQVLFDLLVNARDAIAGEGWIRLEAQAHNLDTLGALSLGLPSGGRWIEFAVSDSGRGFDAETRARLFDPFYTSKGVGSGPGLGLSTTYGIVQACGGSIAVESVPGRGSSFRVWLPEATGTERTAVTGERAAEGEAGWILVVEDDLTVRRLVARMLRAAGHAVIEAADGEAALQLWDARGDHTRALVTDINLPGMDGVELGRRLCAAKPGLGVVFISGAASGLTSGLPGGTGAGLGPSRSCVMGKPFSEEMLLQALQSVSD